MRTAIGIDIAAPPDLVFRLARDPLRWPALLPHYVRARPLSRQEDAVVCEFVARRPLVPVLGLGIPVAWRSRTWSDPRQRRLYFRHLGGATAGMEVTWLIEPIDGGCRVTIVHEFPARLPGWAWFVDRAFTAPIAGRTLRTFKVVAEALARDS